MTKLKLTAIIFLFLGWVAPEATAQRSLGVYTFDHLPQSQILNPGKPTPYRWYLGLPGLSSIDITAQSTAFSLYDIFGTDVNLDEELPKIISNLDQSDRVYVAQTVEILNLGFKTGSFYWSMGAYQSSMNNYQIPSTLFRLAYYGNASDEFFEKEVQVEDMNQFMLGYNTYHLGVQKNFLDDKLTVGIRGKYYVGIYNLQTTRFDMSIYSGIDEIRFTNDILIQTAGATDFIQGNSINTEELLLDYAFGPNNGIGFDIGANYMIQDNWSVSASVTDIGSISWNENLLNYTSKGEFTWDGFEFDATDGSSSGFDYVGDSLAEAFNFEESEGTPYKTTMPMTFAASTEYMLHPKHGFGLVYRGTAIPNGEMYNDYSIVYMGKWARWINFNVSYNMLNDTQGNLGAGVSLRAGAVQFTVMTDNVFGLTNPYEARSSSILFGLNLSFWDFSKGHYARGEETPNTTIPQAIPEAAPAEENPEGGLNEELEGTETETEKEEGEKEGVETEETPETENGIKNPK
ncbi:MAG: hypothetical protein SchgKO_16950 [Schleiferiaceae bacterium]